MISIEILCAQIGGLRPEDVERWVVNRWVRADGEAGQYRFHDIDVARVRLIVELRDVMQVNEDALPVVLGLLDQLYALRRQMRRLGSALDETISEDARRSLAEKLAGRA
ncbi:MAG TPA: hypothetical protein VFN77_03950 [Acetobacteraceae bacterium]|nr:hypothetical protein [Acetobacteraceae bacterium]